MNEEHFNGKVAQKAIIVRGDTVLLTRDPREVELIWELPGGRLNVGEEPRAGLARELKEELGVDCKVHEVVHMEQFVQGNEGARTLVIVYRATLINAQAAFSLDSREVAEARFVPLTELPTLPLYPEYQRALAAFTSLHLTDL